MDRQLLDNHTKSTRSQKSTILGIFTLVSCAFLIFLGLIASDQDVVQGEMVRMMYIHVPAAMASYIGCAFTTVGSIFVLWKKSVWWSIAAHVGAELGLLFAGITIFTGMLWGRPTWGVFWVWDARLTTEAMLFLLLFAYLVMRRLPDNAGAQSSRSAILGLLLVPNVILVRQSVMWWRTLHQQPTLFANNLESKIEGLMLFALFLGFITYGLLFGWLFLHRFRVLYLELKISELGFRQALHQRTETNGENKASNEEINERLSAKGPM